MSAGNPFDPPDDGMNGFMPNMFADVMKMMRVQDPSQFDLISQLALSIASDPDEGNVDPQDRITTEQLTRIAELHVADVTGMTVTPNGAPLNVLVQTRADWINRSLSHWRDGLSAIIRAQGTPTESVPTRHDLDIADEQDQMNQMMQSWMSMLGPTLIAMQIGSVIGHLGTRSLGQYDLLLPGNFSDGPGVVARNRKQFAEDWSLALDDVTMWFSVNDIALHSVLSRTHVHEHLRRLVIEHAKTLRVDPSTLQQQLGTMATGMPSSMTELAELLSEGSALSGDGLTERHQRELETLVTVIRGYADWVTKTVAERVVGTHSVIAEAVSRSRRERSENERNGDAIVGVEHTMDLYERGRHFIEGIIERDGESDLARLWVIEKNLPTAPELDAPGLWLERINLPSADV
jgi:putative hydrolase